MSVYGTFAQKSQYRQPVIKQKLRLNQQEVHKELHCSLSASKEENTKPIINNIAAITPETTATSVLNSPLTKGCRNAKITKAIPKLTAPFPSSLRPFIGFIEKF